jgi:hypothetical protein
MCYQVVLELQENGKLIASDDPPIVFSTANLYGRYFFETRLVFPQNRSNYHTGSVSQCSTPCYHSLKFRWTLFLHTYIMYYMVLKVSSWWFIPTIIACSCPFPFLNAVATSYALSICKQICRCCVLFLDSTYFPIQWPPVIFASEFVLSKTYSYIFMESTCDQGTFSTSV